MPDLRERLKDIEATITALRDQRKPAADELKSAQETYAKVEDLRPGSPEFEATKTAVAALGKIDDDINAWTAEQNDILRQLGHDNSNAATTNGGSPTKALTAEGWDASRLFAADGMPGRLAQVAHSRGPFGAIDLGEVASRDTFAADVAPTSVMRRGEFQGIVPQLARQLRVLDLFQTGTMDQNTFPYVTETGTWAAAEQTEGATKAEDNVTYTDATATAQTIAAWLKIKRQALADVPALQTIIDQRLRYSVQRRLEGQALNGNGSDPNMRGILATSGIGTVAYDAGELIADQILTGITTVLLADAMADGIIMYPTDWQTVLKAKAVGDGHYYSGGPFSMTPQTLWGVPLIPSAAIPVGHSLVGDFAIGATLFIREGVTVRLSDSDASDFTQNRVTLLGEMRAALAVWRPSAFVDVDIAA